MPVVFFLQVDPIITKGNEHKVHHMLLFGCTSPIDDSHHGKNFKCDETPDSVRGNCNLLLFGWAIGAPVSIRVNAFKGLFMVIYVSVMIGIVSN